MALSPTRPKRPAVLVMWPVAILALLSLGAAGRRNQALKTGLLGTVETSDGKPVPGVELVAKASSSGKTFRTVSNQDGMFFFEGTPEDKFSFTAKIAGEEIPLLLKKDDLWIEMLSYEIHITIPRAVPITGVIRGTVKSPAGAAIVGVAIVFRKSGEADTTTTTDGKGEYRQEGLFPGAWKMRVTAARYKTEKRSVKLAPREESTQNFGLHRVK